MIVENPRSLPEEVFVTVELKPLVSPEVKRLTFGEQIGLLRRRAKLSQRELASITGIDHGSISRLEKGQHTPYISTVAILEDALQPTLTQTFRLIASLAKEEDQAYIDSVLGLSGSFDQVVTYGLNVDESQAPTFVEKVRDYAKRRNRTSRQIAEKGSIDHVTVSRILNGESKDILGTSFISLAKGLGLKTQKQVLDLFYATAELRKNSVVEKTLQQKAS